MDIAAVQGLWGRGVVVVEAQGVCHVHGTCFEAEQAQ